MGFGSRHTAETDDTKEKKWIKIPHMELSIIWIHNFCVPNILSECQWISKNVGNLQHLMAQLHRHIIFLIYLSHKIG